MSTTARNPGSIAIISNHKPQSDSSFLSETTLATKKVSEPEDATIAWVQHVCQKFVDTFMARNRNSIQMTGLKIPDTNMPCEALLKLVMAVLDDRSPEDVALLVEHMLKKVIEDFGQQNAGQDFEGPPLKSVGRQNANVQPGMHDNKSVAQEYSAKLEAQNSELKELKYALEATKLQFQNLQFGWEKEMEVLNVKLHGLAQAAAEYHKLAAENRELYNQVQDLKGNIRVYCRVRPFLSGQNATQSTVEFIGEKGSIVIANPSKLGKEQRKAFTFNKVFGPSSSQEQVFIDTQPLIRSVLDGFNVCIFAYGQTGSGKTYTMTGNPSPEEWGVNFRALHDLFGICKTREHSLKYEIGVQMIEIYNEQVRDLLSTDGSNKKLEIRNNSQQNGLNIPDAKLMPVQCTEDVLELMSLGQKNRAVGATALNERSSRSHSVLTVHVKGMDLATGSVLRGCLHLVDLAGSERVDKSEATGDRLKEAQHINKSLSALGDVIAALAQKSPHIPYRNSKLTQVLQDSLGGQAKTLMFVHMSPDCDSYSETISTLKFAERVATVELGAAHSNKESGEVKELKDQVSFLKDALARKDTEVEFLQKELKARGLEHVHDRARSKSGSLSGQSSISTGYGNHRLSVGGREIIGGMENCYLDIEMQSAQMHSCTSSPLGDTPQASAEFEDSLKRRAYEGTFLDSSSSSGTLLDLSPLALSGMDGGSVSGSKKNKVRHGSFEELDSFMPGSLLERTRSSSMEGYGCDLDGGGQMNERPNTRHAGSKLLPSTDLQASPVAVWQATAGPMKMAADFVDNYLSEEYEIASEHSDADLWQITGLDDDISVASFGNRLKEGDRRVLSQQPGHLTKKPTATQVQTMAHSPKKHGSGLAAEFKSKGGKASPELKFVGSKKPN